MFGIGMNNNNNGGGVPQPLRDFAGAGNGGGYRNAMAGMRQPAADVATRARAALANGQGAGMPRLNAINAIRQPQQPGGGMFNADAMDPAAIWAKAASDSKSPFFGLQMPSNFGGQPAPTEAPGGEDEGFVNLLRRLAQPRQPQSRMMAGNNGGGIGTLLSMLLANRGGQGGIMGGGEQQPVDIVSLIRNAIAGRMQQRRPFPG